MTATHETRRVVIYALSIPLAAIVAVSCVSLLSPSPPDAVEDSPQVSSEGPASEVALGTATGKNPDASAGSSADPPLEEAPTTAANEPEEWAFRDEYTLRVQKTRTVLPSAADGGPTEIDVLTYNGRLVGPTIRVRRGTTFTINLINELPATSEPPLTVGPTQEDKPHDFHTTNLHTHGLHVSPRGKSDDVFREIRPGTSHQYTYTVPLDHPTGTFWYHPHKHGSVAYQMANGMAGALIVQGGPPGKVRDLEDVPEIARARERVFILQQLVLRKNEQGIGRVDPNDVYQETPGPDAYQVTAINGAVLPTYYLQPKEVQRWRFIHAGRGDLISIGWRDADKKRIRTIFFHQIAIDGLATGTIRPQAVLQLYGGYRSDVLVKAPSGRGTYYLTTDQEPTPEQLAAGIKSIVTCLARIIVQGPERDMALPSAADLAACKPFPSIAPGECAVKRDVVFSYDDQKKTFHLNGVSFSRQASLDKPVLGSAEEWTLNYPDDPSSSANEPHPFHIHVNPFQVVQIENIATGHVTKVDEWRDTVVVEKGKRLTIRMRFRDFAGKTVVHCHTLDHEDQGMMRAIDIVDPSRPAESDAATLIDCSTPAPLLRLPASRESVCDLSELRGRVVVLVFLRGMECTHCTQQLRNLLREVRGLADTGTTMVAVSSEPITDTGAALRFLDVPPRLPFHLLTDEDHRAFRSFGCYDQGPRHGLFVIDQGGRIRARYVGDDPFADVSAVSARVRGLLAADRPGVNVGPQAAQPR